MPSRKERESKAFSMLHTGYEARVRRAASSASSSTSSSASSSSSSSSISTPHRHHHHYHNPLHLHHHQNQNHHAGTAATSSSTSAADYQNQHVTFRTPEPRRPSRHVTFQQGTCFDAGSEAFHRRARKGKAKNPAMLMDRESPEYLEALRTWAAEREYL